MPRNVYLTNADRALLRPKVIKFHKMNPSFTKTELAKKFDVSYTTIKNWIEFDEKFNKDATNVQVLNNIPKEKNI